MKLKTPLILLGTAAVAGLAYKAYDFFSKNEVTVTVDIDEKDDVCECGDACDCHDDESCDCEEDACCSSVEEEFTEDESLEA